VTPPWTPSPSGIRRRPDILRPYQANVVAAFEREVAAGRGRIASVAPTGSGKTVIICEIIRRSVEGHKRVLVLTHRREIVGQISTKLADSGIRHGIIQAGFSPCPLEPVQIASISTLWSRAFRGDAMQRPEADLLIIDECHHAPAQTYQKIIDAYPRAGLLGLTATPCRGDGRGLGNIFEVLIEGPQVAALIGQGHLVNARVYAPVDPDVRGVETRQGDYVESQLAERMDRPGLIGDVVAHWHQYGERRRTVVFAVNVAHSIHLRDEFIRAGVRAEHIDGRTPPLERDAVLARLGDGEIELVTNCMVLTEGWDMPEVGCCVLARPTKRMGLYRQMIGRVLRPAPGKADAIILDHSGAVFRHGLPEDRVEWTLDTDLRAEAPAHQARLRRAPVGLIECSQCTALRIPGRPCPACGFLPQPPVPTAAAGALKLVDPAEMRACWHGMLTHIGLERGYRMPGWAAVNYKEKFGTWPPHGKAVVPIEPTPEVLSWVRAKTVAYARRQQGVVA
jgi:superfamily II DNA or RNA helicase